MSYLAHHHGSYWFQLRVPAALVPRFSRFIRIHLQTQDRVTAQHQAYHLAGHWLARFQAEQLGLDSTLQDLLPGQPETTPVIATVVPTVQGVVATPSATAPTYDDLYQAWKRLDPDRDPTVLREMRAIANLLKAFTGKAPGDLQRADVARLRDHLTSQRLARGTISKKVGFVSTLLQAGYDAGLLPANVARGLRIPKAKVETLVRRSFTATELERLITSPVYTQRYRPVAGGGEAAAWLPLIALASGARLEEIAQLRTDDILIDPVHGPLLRITDQGEGQELKTESSRRTVPVHPELVRTGLLRYTEAVRVGEHEWLFPDLEGDHDGRRGANFSKWFQRHLRSKQGLGISDPSVVYHSFRHTFKTLCRAASVDEEVSDALTGHAPSSVGRNYGEMPLSRLVPAIHSLVFPVVFPVVQE